MENKNFKAIDFFCGGGGMTCGFTQAGVDVIAGVDFDKNVKETYEYNNRNSKFVFADISVLEVDYFERVFNIRKNDDEMIFIACSPCQFYSSANTRKSSSIHTKDLLLDFYNFVEYYRPGFITLENVHGLLTHEQSVLPEFINKIRAIGYSNIIYDIVDMSYHGVPQSRKRFSLIATRLDVDLELPKPDVQQKTVRETIGEHNGFPKIPAGYKDFTDFNHTCMSLSDLNIRRLKATRHDGGDRRDYVGIEDLSHKRDVNGIRNNFIGTYGRIWWYRPSPTITTKSCQFSAGRFGHPEEDRGLSVRECATLQSFPKDYVFKTGSLTLDIKIIGNSVPPEYARRLANSIKDSFGRKRKSVLDV